MMEVAKARADHEFRFSKSAREPFTILQSFNPPEHKTLNEPANLYQLSQVGNLPGDEDDSEDEDDFLANEAKAFFEMDMCGGEEGKHGYGTGGVYVLPRDNGDEKSPFLASGEFKRSRHIITKGEGDGVDLVRGLPDTGEDSGEEEGEDEVLVVTGSVIPPPSKPPTQVPALRIGPRKAKTVKREEEKKKQVQLSTRSDPGLTSEKIMKIADDYHLDLAGSQTARAAIGRGIGTPATVASTDQEDDGDEGEEKDKEERMIITDAISFNTTRSQMDLMAAAAKAPPFSPIKARRKGEEIKPYSNYKSRFVEMQKEDKTRDWYVANDGSPYISKFQEQLKKDRGDPKKMMCGGKRGFRVDPGKASRWEMLDHHGVRNSGPYSGHHEEALLLGHRSIVASKQNRHKWHAQDKGWMVIGCRTQPEHRRLVARGFYGKHGDLHEGTAKDKHL